MKLIARSVLRAVSGPYCYTETEAVMCCAGMTFTAKGKTVTDSGWRRYTSQTTVDNELPMLSEGQVLEISSVAVKEGKTAPPKRFTEASLLSAMESTGAKDMPEDAERRGISTPATHAATIEKLVSSGYVERVKAKKTTQLQPTQTGISLITVLPEQLQSPQLTAEWEQRLQQIERGVLAPESFDREIADMIGALIADYTRWTAPRCCFRTAAPLWVNAPAAAIP